MCFVYRRRLALSFSVTLGDTHLSSPLLRGKGVQARSDGQNNVLHESSLLRGLLCRLLHHRRIILSFKTQHHLLLSGTVLLRLSPKLCVVLLQA